MKKGWKVGSRGIGQLLSGMMVIVLFISFGSFWFVFIHSFAALLLLKLCIIDIRICELKGYVFSSNVSFETI